MKRSGRVLAAIGCAAVMSVAAPVMAHATEPAPVEAVEAAQSGRFVFDDLPAGKVNVLYRHQFTFTGNAKSILAEHLPAGLRMEPNGLLTGLPAEAHRPGLFLIAAFDWNTMQLVEQWVTIPGAAEADRPIFSGSLPPASSDEKYTYKLQATAPADTSLTFTASGLPEGYAMTTDGLITGEMDAKPGSYTVTFTATARHRVPGGVPVSSSVTWTLVVAEPERPVIADTVLPPAIHDTPYSYQVTAKAPPGRPSLTFTASGLPDGYSMSQDGIISGRANSPKLGKSTVTIGVSAHAPGRPPVAGEPITVSLEVVKGATNGWYGTDGSLHRIIFDGGLDHYEGHRSWRATCPADSWLDARAGTAGRSVGQGIVVRTEYRETDVKVPTRYGSRTTAPWPDRNGKETAINSVQVEAFNAMIGTSRGVYIEMVCTSDPAHAWRG